MLHILFLSRKFLFWFSIFNFGEYIYVTFFFSRRNVIVIKFISYMETMWSCAYYACISPEFCQHNWQVIQSEVFNEFSCVFLCFPFSEYKLFILGCGVLCNIQQSMSAQVDLGGEGEWKTVNSEEPEYPEDRVFYQFYRDNTYRGETRKLPREHSYQG